MAEQLSITLHSSAHAYPPDRTGMAPATPSMWLLVTDRSGSRWIKVTREIKAALGLLREATADAVEDGGAREVAEREARRDG